MVKLSELKKFLHHKNFPDKWIWQSITWEDIREEVLKEIECKTKKYPPPPPPDTELN